MRLKEIRQMRNVTQEELASALGLKKSVISKYENGHLKISQERLEQIASFLDVSINVLTTNDALVLNVDGSILSLNQVKTQLNLDSISDPVLTELVSILSSHDLEWQQSVLKKLKLQEVVNSKELDSLIKILNSTIISIAILAVGCQILLALF